MAEVQMSSPDHPASSIIDFNAAETLEAQLALEYLNAQLQINHKSAKKRYDACRDHGHLPEERSTYDLRSLCSECV